ncbi:L-histidine N(alpha)-methyltransferase [Candidatus Nitrotoga sp. AM1P]|uniref:L-histidine N(alpha)-methyltransferase n=1 Tax=Candidatus Nitrotoga sp. AM1P TaxID=2559597 RepID=UPI0010B75712|nr:L-histidine N(alpha)-methyltransferase [Candidatus Nitrotoga sp. AM1P]BBJ22675.1 dimethylhistidine N-methyltransferase [Candidatus Nitrotoga sp. AM1P]
MQMEYPNVLVDIVESENFRLDVCAGLRQQQRSIPPKYFYDAQGSALFQQICETAEYYPTRTETAILDQYSVEMMDLIGQPCALVEFGCGSAVKTPLLMRHLDSSAACVLIDICKPQLEQTEARLVAQHPDIKILSVCADYTQLQVLPLPISCDLRPVIFFPGSTIGNYTPEEAQNLLRKAAKLIGPNGSMLIGVDCKKDPAILNNAYNDKAGLTKAFNLNLLARMERELGAEIEPEGFTHYAFYNPVPGRVEMHLVSRFDQVIRISGEEFWIGVGETIHTENSYKYRPDEFKGLARNAGWHSEMFWTDANKFFSIHLLRVS